MQRIISSVQPIYDRWQVDAKISRWLYWSHRALIVEIAAVVAIFTIGMVLNVHDAPSMADACLKAYGTPIRKDGQEFCMSPRLSTQSTETRLATQPTSGKLTDMRK